MSYFRFFQISFFSQNLKTNFIKNFKNKPMKKTLFIVFMLVWSLSQAQVPNIIYKQNFNNYNEDMIMIDNDHLTPHVSGYDTWVVKNGVAASTSWYDDGNKTADDWMISPVIHLGDHPSVLWSALTPDPNYPDGYQVLVTTDTAHPDSLSEYQVVFSIAHENSTWTYRTASLSDYANKDVRIAWRNNSTDEYFLYIDNIFVYNAEPYDLWLVSAQVPTFIKNNVAQKFTYNILNVGYNTINKIKLEYNIVGSSEFTSDYDQIDTTLNPGDYVSLTTSSMTFTKDGIHYVTLNTKLDDNEDNYHDNDTVKTKFSVWSQGAHNLVLIEHFTQASCGPCAQQNPRLNKLIQNNDDKVAHIAYHTWWPGTDPMYDYNPAPVKIRVKYYGISGVPTVVVNGSYLQGSPQDVTQQVIDKLYGNNGLAQINVWHQRAGDSLHFHIRIIPMADFPTPVRLYTVWVEDKKYASAPGSNGETNFPDVMRQMLPDGNGYELDSLKQNDTLFADLSCKYDSQIDYNKSSVVVFLQNYDTKDVYVTYKKNFSDATGIENIQDKDVVSIYPNPVDNMLFIRLSKSYLPLESHLEIIDPQGRVVLEKTFTNGSNLRLNVSSLNPGIYILRINNQGNIYTKEFVKQ